MSEFLVGGRFRAERIVGSGFVSHVFRARDLDTGRTVALKVPRSRGDSGAALAALRREADVLSRVRDPALPELLGAALDDEESAWLALPFYEGASLEELRGGGALSLEELRPILRAVSGALDALHAAGFVHCDVKPANLLRRPDGSVLLIDLNVAIGVGEHHGGQFVGSPPYMAPELWRGEPVGPATDVYALAAVALSLLSGEPLFRAATIVEWMRAHIDHPVRGPRARGLSIDEAVEQALLDGLAKDPLARPARASALARRLGAIE